MPSGGHEDDSFGESLPIGRETDYGRKAYFEFPDSSGGDIHPGIGFLFVAIGMTLKLLGYAVDSQGGRYR